MNVPVDLLRRPMECNAVTPLEKQAKANQHCRLFHWRYGMICHRNSLIRQSYHFTTDFHRVLLHLVDIWTLYSNTDWAADIHHRNAELL